MHHNQHLTIMPMTLYLLLSTLLPLASTFPFSYTRNITNILAKYPQFSTFNHHLTTSGLALEINARQNITVCVVDNPTIHRFLAKWCPSTKALRRVLNLHVLLKYYWETNLRHLSSRSTLTITLFFGSTLPDRPSYSFPTYLNITDIEGGRQVLFSTKENIDGGTTSYLVRSVREIPYDISFVQINHILAPHWAQQNEHNVLSNVMFTSGCGLFAKMLLGRKAERIYKRKLKDGLTVFCPIDYAMQRFAPKFEKLSEKQKDVLLMYHGVPDYQPESVLRDMNNTLLSTLAADRAVRFDLVVENVGKEVKLKTEVVTARIVDSLIDSMPLAIYAVDKVLLPEVVLSRA